MRNPACAAADSNAPANAECRMRSAPAGLARRGVAATGQRTAQPILATKPGEFNRPEMTMSLQGENDQVISNLNAAAHMKMIKS
ncbi:hypothetical protein D1006_31025 [Burkholderia stabilis]|uniref:Uncharacterized protein n=1 Tax=Burkholderia stabilis TaxID=95485 RepID=A0A4Q2AJ64_9BURK|nr:hypothetical protein D1006_31025 [Burkholderia stabilis]